MPVYELSVTAIHRDTVTIEADSEEAARARILEEGYANGDDIKSVHHDVDPEIEIGDARDVTDEQWIISTSDEED
ncbi:hypothetical protein CcrKarma_gp253 [Caulobacter virus Karma]|uniref:Uncharacterized protein n=1 Tax=Caulobacter phage CcrSwift TaxID=2927984 RepID=K4JVX3_9CAUD|nr:hypothetical protein CcrMagneto_gp247 [Caulobacter virus Magneto]YP_006989633.1 hypothetical protein CcrKarma_gp253 [Caulobacter virus Karma]YP_006989980.1 hypothetical protein D870_gp174 [Caulobacter phage CcrSwift]AFU87417.1 hypothetical protein CcrMagneto_gp247 [Caulobacter virus Magneto]AFU87770.1 hypothetical protein CcrKarma_gp253 [Caulobacter virus Karma]AFU88565.1 hypothetical protein CcrSwift_gp247 [Caulobacter phage CcrSwift]